MDCIFFGTVSLEIYTNTRVIGSAVREGWEMAPSNDMLNRTCMDLYEMSTIYVDDDGIWHRPEYPRYTQDLAAPKPFLVPSFDDEIVEVLPSEKKDRKICFDESVYVLEIENRFQLMEPEEIDDDESYEIEIVERSGASECDDADFYLEMIDGEIFYVFETEDDISVDENEEESEQGNDASSASETTNDSRQIIPMQLNIGDMMAPLLDLEESSKHLDAGDFLDDDMDSVRTSEHDESRTNMIICENIESVLDGEKSQTLPKNLNAIMQDGMEVLVDKLESLPSFASVTPDDELQNNMNPSSPSRPLVDNTMATSQQVFESPHESPVRSTPTSILKVNTPSPSKQKKKADRKIKKDKKEKTFTKTFVRVADFDGEHRVYNWEKPTWTNQKLKSTGKGDDIRKGGNLANPITDAAVLIQKGEVKWEKPEWALQNSDSNFSVEDVNAKEELIRKIQDGSMNLRGMRNSRRRLKLSINGDLLAAGNDIVKPITKATIIKKPANINYVANPKILRATSCGSKVWNGESLAAPVTQATSLKKYDWEKPSWVSPQLHSTGAGEILKAGADVTKPVGNNAKVEWEKPDWTKKRTIGRHKSSDLSEMKREYKWEQPSWAKGRIPETETIQEGNSDGEEGIAVLKPTEKGQLARRGANLARPITLLPHLNNETEEKAPPTRTIRRTVSDDF